MMFGAKTTFMLCFYIYIYIRIYICKINQRIVNGGKANGGKVDIIIFKKYGIFEALTKNMQPTESFNLLVVHTESTSSSKCSCV